MVKKSISSAISTRSHQSSCSDSLKTTVHDNQINILNMLPANQERVENQTIKVLPEIDHLYFTSVHFPRSVPLYKMALTLRGEGEEDGLSLSLSLVRVK